MGCATRSATSSVARRTTCSFNTDAEHTPPYHFTGPRSPTRATIAHPMQTDRRATMTMHVSIRQSADPLSKNSRKSGNFGEWDCGLADEPTGHHYARALHPTHPTSGNQNDTLKLVTKWCTPLWGHYTSSELVQCSLTGVTLPYWCRAARHGSAGILLKQQWGRYCRAWACCAAALHYLAQHCTR